MFITARAEIRALRRFNELVKKGDNVSFNEILKNLNDRDRHDINRKINPLVQANDAILIDNSDLSIKDQNLFIEELINNNN